MIKRVIRIGAPSLRKISQPVAAHEFNTSELNQLIQDILDTMRNYNGAGLCAPQIGVNKRVMIFEITHNPRYPEAEPIPLTILVNPSYEVLSADMTEGYEGCLSIPGLRGLVARPDHIRYQGYDAQGQLIEREVRGFYAKVFQHEYDHLDGILFPDKLKDTRSLGFTEELVEAGKMPPILGERVSLNLCQLPQ